MNPSTFYPACRSRLSCDGVDAGTEYESLELGAVRGRPLHLPNVKVSLGVELMFLRLVSKAPPSFFQPIVNVSGTA